MTPAFFATSRRKRLTIYWLDVRSQGSYGTRFFLGWAGNVLLLMPMWSRWRIGGKLHGKASPDRKSFDSMVILTCWHLWKERNKRTFDKKEATTDVLLSYVSDEVVCWCQAGLGHLKLVAVAFGSSAGRELASP